MAEYSEEFWEKMKNRMAVSYYKYGPLYNNRFTHHSIEDLKKRIKQYEETGNTEWLVDAANFAMIEFMFPLHENAHFRATDSHESPGIKKREDLDAGDR